MKHVMPVGFMLVHANYTDIFYHRSMEKDKLSILDLWGAYGQKDIKTNRRLSDKQGKSSFISQGEEGWGAGV